MLTTKEQRNLTGLRSVSPQGHFFRQRFKSNTKSLNYDKRLKDHRQIVKNNQAMLQRLQGKRSEFNV
jgi:hypothetical protein